jgi:hypothetical protein
MASPRRFGTGSPALCTTSMSKYRISADGPRSKAAEDIDLP